MAADAAVSLADLRSHRSDEEGPRWADILRELEAPMTVFEDLGDEAGLARALYVAGRIRLWRGQSAAGLEDLDRAARLARSAGDRGQEAECLQDVLLAMLLGPMPVGEAIRRCEQIRPHGTVNLRLQCGLLEKRGQFEAMVGHFDVARKLIADARRLAEEVGLQLLLDTTVAYATAYVDMLTGDAAAAVRTLRPACEGLERIGEMGFLSTYGIQLADALAVQGHDEEALELTERWRPELTDPEDAESPVEWRQVRARLLARRGDLAEAERLAREAASMASRTDYLQLRARAASRLAEVLRLAGNQEESATALREAIRLHQRKGNVVAAAALAASTPASAHP